MNPTELTRKEEMYSEQDIIEKVRGDQKTVQPKIFNVNRENNHSSWLLAQFFRKNTYFYNLRCCYNQLGVCKRKLPSFLIYLHNLSWPKKKKKKSHSKR